MEIGKIAGLALCAFSFAVGILGIVDNVQTRKNYPLDPMAGNPLDLVPVVFMVVIGGLGAATVLFVLP